MFSVAIGCADSCVDSITRDLGRAVQLLGSHVIYEVRVVCEGSCVVLDLNFALRAATAS